METLVKKRRKSTLFAIRGEISRKSYISGVVLIIVIVCCSGA